MKAQNLSLTYASGIENIVEKNASFDQGLLRVCYTGKNRNKSSIDKAVFERCMKSIYNVPIVCRYDREVDEIGAHDIELVHDNDGGARFVNMTHPIGVIPESAKHYWGTVTEDDGTEHEYLYVDTLLWKRQEAYKKIKQNGITDESMEISVLEMHLEDGVCVIDDFEFTAFCLLGTAEPCFESAALLTFTEDDFREQYHAMIKELKESYQSVAPSGTGTDTENYSEGGNETLDQENTNMPTEVVDEAEPVVDNAEETLDEKLPEGDVAEVDEQETEEPQGDEAEPAVEESGNEPDGDNADEPADEPDQSFALAGLFMRNLCEAVSAEKMETAWGEESRYWYVDHDDEIGEVYVNDGMDWKLYGFAYKKNGDNVEIDFASKKRMKFAIVEYDEGDQTSVAGDVFARATEQFTALENAWSEKFANAEAELGELRAYKQGVEDAEKTAAFERECESVFAKFPDLVGNEAFDALVAERAEFSCDELEEKCYAIRGRMQSCKFSLQTIANIKTPKLPVESHLPTTKSNAGDPYGGVFQHYGVVSE